MKVRLNKKSLIDYSNNMLSRKFLTLFFIWAASLYATPTSVFWTPCTTEVVPVGVGEFGADCYFKLFPEPHRGQILTPDLGLTIGALNWYDLKMEIGLDYLPAFPSVLITNDFDCPILFNSKIAIDECRLFPYAPSFAVGIFALGVTTSSSLNIFYTVVGKKLPCYLSGGDFYLGAYKQSKTFGKNKYGLMVAYQKKFCKQTYCDDEEYFKWVFTADYATGKNESGAGGVGLYYYFSPYVSVAVGPTFFNSAKIYGSWKWAVFFDVDFPIVTCKDPCKEKGKKKEKAPKSAKQEEAEDDKGEKGEKKPEKAQKEVKSSKQENA